MLHKFSLFPASDLIAFWRNKNLISQEEQNTITHFLLEKNSARDLPLYIRVLSAIGAFISTLCLGGFLLSAHIINLDSKANTLFFGVFFILMALLVARNVKKSDQKPWEMFKLQLSFCMMATGKLLTVFGLVMLVDMENLWGVSLALFLVTMLTYNSYAMSLDRFLSLSAFLVSLLAAVQFEPTGIFSASILLVPLFFIEISLATLIFTHGKTPAFYIPAGYALIFALSIFVLWASWGKTLLGLFNTPDLNQQLVSFIIAIFLIAVMCWIVPDRKKLASLPLVLAFPAILLLALFTPPALLFIVWLLVLGFARQDKHLISSGLVLFPLCIFLFYYNIDLTLLKKSALLFGSGVLLLLVSGYLYRTSLLKKNSSSL